jgi:hypothetical protein
MLVRVKGVEPPRLAALDPKSSVSTNSTIPAFKALLLKSSLQIYSILLNRKAQIFFLLTLLSINK